MRANIETASLTHALNAVKAAVSTQRPFVGSARMAGGRGARRGLRCQNQLRWSDMAKRTCSIEGCERKHYGRGWCAMHWQRWHKHGDPLAGGTPHLRWPDSLLQRMEPQPNGCIYLVGVALTDQGYGRVTYPGGSLAHRAAWEYFVGPIPEGMTVGHKCHDASDCNEGDRCRHRQCVNVEHLALESLGENVLASRNTLGSIAAAKTHCVHGHEFTEENTYRCPSGKRECRTCRRINFARFTARRRGPKL